MARSWTAEEINTLREMYDNNVPDIEIAIELGRTENAIRIKRNRIGLTNISKRRFSEESLESLRESRKKYTKENHPSWKGGRRKNSAGYIEIHKPEHHRARKNGYVFEHILIAEKKLKRKIKKNEHVHHVNGVKTDNRPNNLVVVTPSEHSKIHGKEKRTGVYKKCLNCGNEFYCKPSHAERRKTCSRSCHATFNEFGYSRLIEIPEEKIIKVLEENNNNVKESAKELNIHWSTLYNKIKVMESAKI